MPATEIRITDPYIIGQVEAERDSRGDSTSTKTAARLITERLTQLELDRRPRRDDVSVSLAGSQTATP